MENNDILSDMKPEYRNPYGLWRVTTDCDEGMSTKELGIYEGYIDEIALSIPPSKEGYSGLEFSAVNVIRASEEKPFPIVRNDVPVSLGSGSGKYDMTRDEIIEHMQKLFENRPVVIRGNGPYCGFVIARKKAVSSDVLLQQRLATQAMAKLTDEEYEAIIAEYEENNQMKGSESYGKV